MKDLSGCLEQGLSQLAVGRIALAACIALVALAAAPSRADQESLPSDVQLDSLRDEIALLTSRLDELERDDLQTRCLLSHAVNQRPQQADPYEIGFVGRIHLDHWSYPGDSPGVNAFENGDSQITPQDRLEVRRARLTAQGRLPGQMGYKVDFEFSEALDPEFRDLYIAWNDTPLFGTIQFGNQKRPYGLDHLNSSNFNIFLERPFAVQSFNQDARRLGLAAYGVSDDETWNWRYGVFNLEETQADGAYVSDHYQLELAGRLARLMVNPRDESDYLHLAVAASFAEPDGQPTPGRAPNQARFRTGPQAQTESDWLDTDVIEGSQFYSLLALETALNLGGFQATAEYLNLWLDRDEAFGRSLHFHGGYLQMAWFLTDHYQPWNRRLGIIDRVARRNANDCEHCFGDAWQLAVRWSFVDLSDDNILGGVARSIGVGLNWYWTDRARLQFGCAYGDISEHAPVDAQTDGNFVSLGTRVLIDF